MEPLMTDYGKRLEPNNPNLFNDFGKIIKARTLTPERQGGIVPIGVKIACDGRNVRLWTTATITPLRV
jgi:hypothetical protein